MTRSSTRLLVWLALGLFGLAPAALWAAELPAAATPPYGLTLGENVPDWLKSLRLSGYTQLWLRYEGFENGLRQGQTKQKAAQEASGFSFKQARLAVDYERPDWGLRLEVRFVPQVNLTDAYFYYAIMKQILVVQAGQMKIPGTYEQGVGDRELDFPTRSLFSEQSVDYNLSRHPSLSSPMQGNRGQGRDIGLKLRGRFSIWDYEYYVGNGLGANMGVGAEEDNQYFYANRFGDFLYATRQSLDFARLLPQAARTILPKLAIGGHYSTNTHMGAVLVSDKRSIVNVSREVRSCDLQIGLTRYLTLSGLYGTVHVDDDFDFDNKRDYLAYGWEAKAVGMILPQTLYLAFRVEGYNDSYESNGAWDRRLALSANLSYRVFDNHLRFDLYYRHKRLYSQKVHDIFDDLWLLALQAGF